MIPCIMTAFAGDIPQSLLYDADAQLYFGEVLEYHGEDDEIRMVVKPLAIIKGNVEAGSELVYDKSMAMGGCPVIVGRVYLFTGYENENYVEFYDVTAYDTKTLKLRYVKGTMLELFERYINEGRYGEAKLEGLTPRKDGKTWTVVVSLAGIGVIGAVILYKKKKNEQI